MLGLVIYKDFLLFHYLFVYTDMKDMLLNVWPKYVHLSEYLRTSGFPTWSFNSGLGYNFFAGNLSRLSVVDPTVLLLMLPDPNKLVFYLPYMLLLKLMVAGLLFYRYLLKIKLTQFPAFVGALVYTFCGYSIIYGGWFDFTTEAIFLPILLLAIETYLVEQKKWFYIVLCYFWLALYNPVIVYYFAVFPALYFFFKKRSVESTGEAMRSLWGYVKLLLLGVMMGFVFFWPVFSTLLTSPRVFSGAAGLFSLNSWLEYRTILGRLLSNDFFGTGSAFRGWGNYMEAPMYYCGLFTLLLATQPWGKQGRQQLIFHRFLVAFLGLFLISPFFRGLLNGFSGNYYRLTGYAVPFIIIYFFVTSLGRAQKERQIDKKCLTITYLGILAAVGGLYYSSRDLVNIHALRAVVEFSTIYYLLFVLYGKKTRQELFFGAFLTVACVELVVFALPAVNRPALKPAVLNQSVGYYDDSSRLIGEITAQDKGFYRVDKDFVSVFCCNDAFVQNYRGTGYYESFAEKGYIDFLEGMGLTDSSFQYRSFGVFDDHNYIKELIGVKYGVYKKTTPPFTGYQLVKQQGNVSLYENTYFSSIGFVYDQYVSEDAFRRLDNEATNNSYNSAYLGKEKIMLSAVVVNGDITGLTKSEPSKVLNDFSYPSVALRNQQNALKVDFASQKKITGKVDSAKGGLLYLAIPYNKGWQLIIDGKRVPTMKVNLGFIGAPISPGEHSVVIRYQEPYIYPSLLVSLIGLAVFSGCLIRSRPKII